MFISDAKLIQGLIKNVDQLAASANDPASQTLIRSSQCMLMELNRRADFAQVDNYYRQGRAIIEQATHLALPDAARLATLLANLPAQLPEHRDTAASDTLIDKIRSALTEQLTTSGYPFIADENAKSLLIAATQWDLAGYAQARPDIPEPTPEERPVAIDAAVLEHYLRQHRPGFEAARVVACNPLPGGFSKNTVLFDVETASGVQELVYRGTTNLQVLKGVMVDIAKEYHAVAHAFAHGAAVAEPLWLQADPAATGTRFFISRRMPGRNLGTAIAASEEVSPAATKSLAVELARIHSLPLQSSKTTLVQSHIHPPGPNESLQDVIRKRVLDWKQYWQSIDCGAYPTLQLALQWLYDNVSPADDEPVLVHGDYGLHNILIDNDRVTAVLDWEACVVGDRALDLSHLFNGTRGKMDHELFVKEYVAAGGKAVSEFRLKYYQVMMNMQFMMCTVEAQNIYQQRAAAGTNFCILGLGFIHHTAKCVLDGILDASAAKQA